MSSSALKLLAASGAKGDPVYVDDVFSTYLYKGTGVAQTIVNGTGIKDTGGLLWIKNRSASADHSLWDTETNQNGWLVSNSTAAEYVFSGYKVVEQNEDGFDVNIEGGSLLTSFNTNGNDYTSWTFRKQPGFFDVVTWSGNGTTNRQISHSLGSTPGMIIVKRTNGSDNWYVYHRSLGSGKYISLNSSAAAATDAGPFGTNPTDSVFTVGNPGYLNYSGWDYVAYVFAHDAQDFGADEDESIIKCGTYTGNGSTTGPVIDLGFEPQWLMIKEADASGNWAMLDVMRGIATGGSDAELYANLNNSEVNDTQHLDINADGFAIKTSSSDFNTSGSKYIYMAIRRPHKPAKEFAATDLFNTVQGASSTTNPGFNLGFAPDMAWEKATNGTSNHYIGTRMTGTKYLFTDAGNDESESTSITWDYMNGWIDYFSGMDAYNAWGFKRAPGFFDVVCYTGNGTAGRNVAHNLEAVPEMIWVKGRNAAGYWQVYNKISGKNKRMILNSTGAEQVEDRWANTDPTSDVFTVGLTQDVNGNNYTYIAYLFASVAGISKVGSYTGTGNDLNVDCGFSAGARFILIRRTDSSGDWYLWDSVRGIVAGGDPYLLLNTTAAQVTADYIDPLASGFTVTSSAPAALNASGGTYLFYAIA